MHEYITGSEILDKLTYSFMGLRILVYTYFIILNGFQTYLEIKKYFGKKKKSKSTTRFFVFFWMTVFCIFRDIQTAFFYQNPQLGIGTANFFFFSLGTAAIFLTWIFILHYWLIIMYKFFINDEVRLGTSKPINYSTFLFSIVLIIYQITVSSITLHKNIDTAESVGFLILLLIYSGLILVNGYYLLNHLKKNKKTTLFVHFDKMIFKTKILLGTVIFVVVTIITQELVFNMYYTDTYETPRQYLKLFVIGVIEFIQMVVVMLVLANGNWKQYVLFKNFKSTSESSSELADSKGRKHDTGNSCSLDVSVDVEGLKRKETNDDLRSSNLTSSSFNNSSVISVSIDSQQQQ